MLLVDLLQIYGLLWALSQPWPWPAVWLKWTRWCALFNLDFFSMAEKGAGMGSTGGRVSVWGEYNNYYIYAACWACIPVMMVIIYGAYVALLKWRMMDSIRRRADVMSKLAMLGQLVYLPMGLATLRLVNCSTSGQLQCDPSMQCWTTTHW